MDLEIKTESGDGYTVVECIGELDTYNCGILRSAITELIDSNHVSVVVDLCQVEYVDSTGLGSLVGAMKRISEHRGKMALVSTNPAVNKAFEITALNKVFPIRSTLSEAVDFVTGKAPQII